MRSVAILFLFSVAWVSVSGQVHQKGVAAIDLSIHKSGIGIMGSAAYSRNFTDQAYIQARGIIEYGRLYNFKYTLYGADLLTYYNPFFLSDFFQVNVGIGLTGGYERMTGITKEKAGRLGWIVGVKGAIEAEAFLSDQIGFVLSGRQAFMLKKGIGSNYYEVGIGLRIFINNYY